MDGLCKDERDANDNRLEAGCHGKRHDLQSRGGDTHPHSSKKGRRGTVIVKPPSRVSMPQCLFLPRFWTATRGGGTLPALQGWRASGLQWGPWLSFASPGSAVQISAAPQVLCRKCKASVSSSSECAFPAWLLNHREFLIPPPPRPLVQPANWAKRRLFKGLLLSSGRATALLRPSPASFPTAIVQC